MSESSLLRSIRVAVERDGRVRLWRNNCGVDPIRGVRYGLGVGSSDLVGLVRGSGRFVALEVKTPTGRLSNEQVAWLDTVRKLGGLAIVARSPEDAIAQIGAGA